MADKKSTPIPGVKSDNSSGAIEAEQINEASIAQGMEPARQEKAVSQNELERLILTDPELQGNSEVATTIGNEENKKTVQKSSSPDGSSAAIEKNETENSQKKQDFSASMPAVKMKEKSIGAASAYAQYASDIKGNDAVKFSLQEGGKQNKDLNGNIQTSQNPNKEKIATPAQPAKAQDLAGSIDTGVTGAQVFTSSLKQNVNLFPTLNNTSEVSTLHIQQIVKEVDQSLQAGKNVIHIQLHPENLGKIDIRLSSDASGLGINIIAENASTKRMLENQVDILKQSLNNAGLHLSQMNFGMKGQEGQYERQFYQNDPSNVSKNWFQKPWRESEVGKYNDTPQRMTLQLTTIDYQI
jgi:flagellar hook-length control protein FliK